MQRQLFSGITQKGFQLIEKTSLPRSQCGGAKTFGEQANRSLQASLYLPRCLAFQVSLIC